MRQFDVIVWGSKFDEPGFTPTPPFTDAALGWFFGNDVNEGLEKSDAEWIVISHESMNIDRDFLNDLAQAISGFPMVDAFAPRVHCGESFKGASILDSKTGFKRIPDNAPLRFVAAPCPEIVAFSRRIIQRTGRIDTDLPLTEAIADYSLRMLHAGGKMFSIPYLVARQGEPAPLEQDENALLVSLFKSLGFWKSFKFMVRHPAATRNLIKNRKKIIEKRDSAILLSKLRPNFLKEISK